MTLIYLQSYNSVTKTIDPSTAIIVDGEIEDENLDTTSYPRKNWKDNSRLSNN